MAQVEAAERRRRLQAIFGRRACRRAIRRGRRRAALAARLGAGVALALIGLAMLVFQRAGQAPGAFWTLLPAWAALW